MDLGFGQPSLEAGILRIKAKGLIIGVDRDALTPIDEQKRLAESFGRPAATCGSRRCPRPSATTRSSRNSTGRRRASAQFFEE